MENRRNFQVEVADCSERGVVKRDNGFTRLLTTKSLANSRQKKKLFFGTCATAFVAIVSVLIFYGCQKDKEVMVPQGMKSSGNYSQPTQDVDIHTFIVIDGVNYSVTGQAIAGSYDGQIYGCNLTWTMFVNVDTEYDMVFDAVLKPGLDGTVVGITNEMGNYNITINGVNFVEDNVLEFEVVDGVMFTIAPDDISDLWGRMVEICEENVVIEDMILHGINIAEMAEAECVIGLENTVAEFGDVFLYFTDDELDELEELLKLIQEALNNGNYSLAAIYAEEYMNRYYGIINPSNGKQKWDKFQIESSEYLVQIGEIYPAFVFLSETEQIDILGACYRYKQQKAPLMSCASACRVARDNAEQSAGDNYAISMFACGVLSPTLGPALICAGIATGIYLNDRRLARNHYNECLGNC